jgi:LuxR family maltose regulon positive regulatory protein
MEKGAMSMVVADRQLMRADRGANASIRRLLDQAVAFPDACPVLVLRAPPGYGKSGLLAGLEQKFAGEGWAVGRICGWTGPDGGRVLARKLAAATQAWPAATARPSDEGVEADGFEVWRRQVDGFAWLRGRFGLFIDDVDELFAGQGGAYLKYLLANRPAHLALVLSSHGGLDLHLPGDGALVLGASELARPLAEGPDLSRADAAAIMRATGGWPLLADISQERLDAGADGARQVAIRERLQAFLRDEILARLAPGEILVLKSCCVLSVMTIGDCRAMTGMSEVGEILSALTRKGVLQEPEAEAFRITPLLREAMIRHFSENDFFAVQRAYVEAANLLAGGRKFAEALALGVEAANPDIVLDALDRAGWLLFRQRGHSELLAAMAVAPEARVAANPSIAALRAWCQLFAGDINRASAFVNSRQAAEQAAADPRIAEHLRGLSRALAGRADMSEAALLSGAAADEADAAFVRSLTLLHVGGLHRARGTMSRSIENLKQSIDVAEGAACPYVSLASRIALGQALHLTGRLRAADRCYVEALGAPWEATSKEPLLGALALVRRTQLNLELGDLDLCDRLLDEVEQHVNALEGARTFGMAALQRARIAWSRGEGVRAEQHLSVARRIAIVHNAPRLLFFAKLEESRLRLAAGDIDHAESLVLEAAQIVGASGQDPQADKLEPLAVFRAHVHMARGQYAVARALLAEGLQTAQAAGRFAHSLYFETLTALCWLQEGSDSRAIESFETSFIRARREGIQQTFVDFSMVAPMARLLHLLERKWTRSGALQEDCRNLTDLLRAVGARTGQTPPQETYVRPTEKFGQKDVLMLFSLSRGLRNNEIAEQMSLSVETVKWRLKQIYAKLYVRNRTEALVRARSLGLID